MCNELISDLMAMGILERGFFIVLIISVVAIPLGLLFMHFNIETKSDSQIEIEEAKQRAKEREEAEIDAHMLENSKNMNKCIVQEPEVVVMAKDNK